MENEDKIYLQLYLGIHVYSRLTRSRNEKLEHHYALNPRVLAQTI